jgi:hypothetical protein
MSTVLQYIQLGGTVGALSLFLWLLVTGRVVTFKVYKDKARECEDWKEVALTSAGGLDKTLDLMKRRRRDEAREALEG